MTLVPHSDWVWYGYAGHLCVSSQCAYHLCTRIGGFLISTVGDYRPRDRGGERETIGSGKRDFFETFIFRCDGEDGHGNPTILGSEIASERYPTSIKAEHGHRSYCEKYAALSSSSEAAAPTNQEQSS